MKSPILSALPVFALALLLSTPLCGQDEDTAPLPYPNAAATIIDPNTPAVASPVPDPCATEPPPLPEPNDIPDFGPLDPNDPNSPIVAKDPNDPFHDAHRSLSAPPDDLTSRTWHPPTEYWRPSYHPQTSELIFRAISYPYYPGGIDYHEPSVPTEPIPMALSTNDDPNADPNLHLDSVQDFIERRSTRLHQWRSINESPAVLLAVLRTIELTRKETGIYLADPGLAVDAKRTLGRLARTNRRFDLISRAALRPALAGRTESEPIYRMDKLLADLTGLLDRLAEQNDLLSIALGLGKVERACPCTSFSEPINYSNLGLIPTD